MSKHTAFSHRPSLLERAAEIYDFGSGARIAPVAVPPREAKLPEPRPVPVPQPPMDDVPDAEAELTLTHAAIAPPPRASEAAGETRIARPAPRKRQVALPARYGTVDRSALREAEFILPDAPPTALAEEFRIVKRQLLLGVAARDPAEPAKRQTILVCSAQPDEGKTFCAVNLALSLATEKDLEVLLVDGDFNKPEILSILGLETGPGLIDAIADPAADPNDFVIATDIPGLSVLPSGRQANNVSELLSSERTGHVLDALTGAYPRRIVLFDSPPALMASPAAVLAAQVGQVVMVVRADQTTEADLKEAVGLLSGCDNLSLLLNGTGFAATGRRFGSYYGLGQ
ncbi:MAG TPA: hypothetical protein VGW34_07905 [Allosphingosinicella sp.]|nr:hypothetical protein [Allosphingosinicella sp.]